MEFHATIIFVEVDVEAPVIFVGLVLVVEEKGE